MSDRPILFSGPMVRALIEGRKTQTRRIAKVVKDTNVGCEIAPSELAAEVNAGNYENVKYAPGDRLYVREMWSGPYVDRDVPPRDRPISEIWYWADGNPEYGDWERPRPGIHMPRWASRLTLHVTAVRMQRLQDISEADARAEGIGRIPSGMWHWKDRHDGIGFHEARHAFDALWCSINGAGGPNSWTGNPWVIALTFSVHKYNIDELKVAA